MDIQEVDLDDDASMTSLAEIDIASSLHERPWAPVLSPSAWVAHRRSPDSGERQHLLMALDGDRPVAVGTVWVFALDNLDKAYLELAVDPGARGRGVGSALLEPLLEVTRREERTLALADIKVPFERVEDHPYRAFAEHHGFVFSNVEVVREQDLPVPDDRFAAWAASAAERAADYELRTYVNEIPDEVAPSLCVLLGQLAVDAPTGAVDFEEEVMTTQRLRERQAAVEAMDHDLFETVALTPDGTVAAQSTLVVQRTDTCGHQWGTFVHREHRGRRLGLAVKAANLRAVQQAHPHLTRVSTQNAETNAWMIAINEQLGYRPVEAAVELLRRL